MATKFFGGYQAVAAGRAPRARRNRRSARLPAAACVPPDAYGTAWGQYAPPDASEPSGPAAVTVKVSPLVSRSLPS